MREKYENEWEKFQKSRVDFDPNENIFCQLFPCK